VERVELLPSVKVSTVVRQTPAGLPQAEEAEAHPQLVQMQQHRLQEMVELEFLRAHSRAEPIQGRLRAEAEAVAHRPLVRPRMAEAQAVRLLGLLGRQIRAEAEAEFPLLVPAQQVVQV
jgi:hypothetical protein